jgi:hypothetical protein
MLKRNALTVTRHGHGLQTGCCCPPSCVLHPTPHLVDYMCPRGETVGRVRRGVTVLLVRPWEVIFFRAALNCPYGETSCPSGETG